MADVKVSALTALTGANLANGDQFLVTDVGSPNVSKSITADELAQGSQFSSRFKPLASDVISLSASMMSSATGSPSLSSTATWHPAWLFDQTSVEGVHATFIVPPSWSSIHVDFWWTNASTGSGDVRWTCNDIKKVDGDTLNTSVGGASVDVTAPAQGVLKKSRIRTSLSVTAGQMVTLRAQRTADNVGDTLGNDAALICVEIVRAS